MMEAERATSRERKRGRTSTLPESGKIRIEAQQTEAANAPKKRATPGALRARAVLAQPSHTEELRVVARPVRPPQIRRGREKAIGAMRMWMVPPRLERARNPPR